MGRRRRKLDEKSEAGEVLRCLKKEPAGWRRERLRAVELGLRGEHSLEEIAGVIGRSRSRIQEWFDAYRRGGMGELLTLRRGKGPPSRLSAQAAAGMKQKLEEGAWRRAGDAQRWLAENHGLEVGLGAVYKYLGKFEARLKVPRPSRRQKRSSGGRDLQGASWP